MESFAGHSVGALGDELKASESRLSELKTELASVERKIQLSITTESKEQEEVIKINNVQERSSVGLKAM